jgi:hypothetical protein
MSDRGLDFAGQEAFYVLHSQECRMKAFQDEAVSAMRLQDRKLKALQDEFAHERAQLSPDGLAVAQAQRVEDAKQNRMREDQIREEKRAESIRLDREIDEAMAAETPHELWEHDKNVYEKCAPSWRWLNEMDWYDESEESQRKTVYSQRGQDSLERSRQQKKGYWYNDTHENDGPRPSYSHSTEEYLANKKAHPRVKNWRVFDH